MFNWPPTLTAKFFRIPASSLPVTVSVLEDFASGMFSCLQARTCLVILSGNVPSLSRSLCVISMSWLTFQFLPSQGHLWEPFVCSSHSLWIIKKDTRSQCFWHQQPFFLLGDSVVLPDAFSLPYASLAFQFRFSFLLGTWCCPLDLFFYFTHYVFFPEDFFFCGLSCFLGVFTAVF